MYAIGDTFTPTREYAEFFGLNLFDVYTICRIQNSMVYWDGPGLKDLGGYGDGCSETQLHRHLTPCNINLENK